MRFENSTTCTLSVLRRDVRTVEDGLVVIGRSPELTSHYETLAGRPFSRPPWLRPFDAKYLRVGASGLSVVRVPFRPRGPARRSRREVNRCQAAQELSLVAALRHTGATSVSLVPLSCRRPGVVAAGMVRALWDISVASLLAASVLVLPGRPESLTIYCTGDPSALIGEIEHGRYASLRHGWLFNTAVQCDRAKMLRYRRRRRFRFRRVGNDEAG